MTSLTRRCTRCRRRKYLREFYERKDAKVGHKAECKACTKRTHRERRRGHRAPRAWSPPEFFDCQFCGSHEFRHSTNQRTCGRRDCKRQLKHRQNTRAAKKRGDICRDCGAPAYFSRCEACRVKHQAHAEEFLEPLKPLGILCACGQPLSFGSDPMTGRSLEICPTCGERPLRVVGVRHYDQRVDLTEEIENAVERASKPPDEQFRSYGSGMHFRQKSHEYVRRSA